MTDVDAQPAALAPVPHSFAGYLRSFGPGIVIVLTLTGLKLLGLPPEVVGIIGAGLLILGPVAWGLVRQSRGLPAFETIHLPNDHRDH